MVVDKTGHAQIRPLTLAGTVGNQWRVVSGLSPGDQVIIEGGQNAKPGAPVKIVPPTAPVPGPPTAAY
jgi:membrane fusion protein (multidrug efflux system)